MSRFVYGTKANVPDYVVRGGATYRVLSDHLGSVRLVVDATTGSVAQRLSYDAWGRVLEDTSPGFQPFGFAAGVADPLTGLLRFGARDYDPSVGRWTSKDPIGFGGMTANLYGYAAPAPINHRDLTGQFAFLPALGVAAFQGGVAALATGLPMFLFSDASFAEVVQASAIAGAVGAAAGFVSAASFPMAVAGGAGAGAESLFEISAAMLGGLLDAVALNPNE